MKKTIKDAVIEFGGVWPEFSWNESKQNKHAIVKTIKQWEDEEGKIYHKGHIGKGGTSLDSEFCELVCTKSEFEAEAKRMGYINGYKFMEECTEKGKPNLPDDVMVSVMTHGRGRLPAGHVGFWNWRSSEIKSFRVVDERYKPVSEISESKPDAEFEITDAHWENAPVWAIDIRNRFGKLVYTDGDRHCKDVDSFSWGKFYSVAEHPVVSVRPAIEKPESNWFERGEHPPIGIECEMTHEGGWIKCKPIGFDGEGLVCKLYVPEGKGINIKFMPCYGYKFRPIRTEREKFIEQAWDRLRGDTAHKETTELLGQLYDLGYRLPVAE